jgi:hypothetical protein
MLFFDIFWIFSRRYFTELAERAKQHQQQKSQPETQEDALNSEPLTKEQLILMRNIVWSFIITLFHYAFCLLVWTRFFLSK